VFSGGIHVHDPSPQVPVASPPHHAPDCPATHPASSEQGAQLPSKRSTPPNQKRLTTISKAFIGKSEGLNPGLSYVCRNCQEKKSGQILEAGTKVITSISLKLFVCVSRTVWFICSLRNISISRFTLCSLRSRPPAGPALKLATSLHKI